MLTIHDRIEEFLAADFHDELSEAEREDLHTHLMECAGCRTLHKEERIINEVMQSTLEHAKPIFGFENRILSAFRNRVPYRPRRVSGFFVNAIRSRALQIAVGAALLLALFELGQFVSGEKTAAPSAQKENVPPVLPQGMPTSSFTAHAQVLPERKESERPRAEDSLSTVAENVPIRASNERLPTQAQESKSKAEEPATLAKPAAPAPASSDEQTTPNGGGPPATASSDDRKFVRNASLDLEVRSFDEALRNITNFAKDAGGYVATNSSQKQENGKLRGDIVVKVLPENLDDFLGKLRALGELKNQTLTTQDVGKQYLDTDARLRNAHVLEQRLVEMLEKNSGKVSDLLEVEKELGRVREQIEQLEGEIKFMDTQVQFATVTIRLSEKDMDAAAAFLIKERVQLALFVPEVEKVYATIRGLASAGAQITNAALDHDEAGRVSARISMLVAPEESDDVIAKIKAMGRVANFQVQSERVARGGQGLSPDARTEFDKVELNITIAREDDEPSRQQTTLSVRVNDVNGSTKQLAELAAQSGGKIRTSSFSRDPSGAEYANVSLRLPVKNYAALMQSLTALGKLENVAVHREDRPAEPVEAQSAPADVTLTIYSQGNIIPPETGISATFRRALAQSISALMWSVRMVGVALASIAPWAIVLGVTIGLIVGIRRSRRSREP
jgi:Domain of unknown function (DUF4349)